MQESIDYLMQKIEPNIIGKDKVVAFCNLIDDFNTFPIQVKCYVFFQALGINLLFSAGIYLALNVLCNDANIIKGIIGIIVSDIVLSLVILIKKDNKFKEIYIFLSLSAFGLTVMDNSSGNKSKLLGICTSPAKKFNKKIGIIIILLIYIM